MALLLDLLVTGKTRLNDDTYAKNIYADKFIKNGSSDSYVLLGGGGHKTLNDFSMKNHTHSDYLPCLRMRNPSTSNDAPGQGGIPFPLSLKGAGYPLYDDPEFETGTNNVIVYNNVKPPNGAVTLTRIVDSQLSNNSSGYILQISTSTGDVTPGRGGFIQRFPAYANAVYAQIFRAKIPVGFSVVNAENPMGTDYSTHWLTDTAGTGKWEWYIRVTICGKEGNFNENGGGYVYLEGTGAVTWYLSYCNVIDLTRGNYDGLRTKYSDQASRVTVRTLSNNSNYNMVFHGGTDLYSSTGIYCNPNTGIMTLNGLSLLNTGDNCLNINGSITSYKQSGAVLSTYNNSRNSIYLDTIYNLGSGNLSINAPGGNLYLSRERGKTYIGGTTYYIDRAGNLGSNTSRWKTIWATFAELEGLNCTKSAHFDGRWHFVPALTSTNNNNDNANDAQIIAGGYSPIVLVRRTGGTVTLPSSTVMNAENGAWVILIKMNTAPCTYAAGTGTNFYLCWDGGSQNVSSFVQKQNSYMMFYYNTTWYVTQFTYT